jgi:hypothetical protein
MSFTELAGSPRESLNESSGSSAERRFLHPMSSRLTFAATLAGQGYPDFPQARVVAIDLQPWMNEDSLPEGVIISPEINSLNYGDQPCLITVKYGPDYTKKSWPTDFSKPSPIRFGTELRYQIKSTAEFMLVPTSGTRWEDDSSDTSGGNIPVPEDANSAILIPVRTIQLQWDFVDDPPIRRFEDLIGRVNEEELFGSEPETILFEGYSISETFRASPINPHTNRVTIDLTQRRIDTGDGIVGWNHEYREYPEGWSKLLLSDGQPRYKLASYEDIFA